MAKPTNKQISKTEKIIPSGVLTCQEIEEFGLISPVHKTNDDNNCLQLTTYDLRLGEFHYVSSKKEWIPTYIGDGSDEIYKMIKDQPTYYVGDAKLNRPGNELTIPPYGKALIQLLETVDTANVAKKGFFIVGHFDLKLSKVQKGLISQQATQVEPYYKGKLFCYLFNLSRQEIKLKYGERIASIEFTYVSSAEYKNKNSWKKTTTEFYNSSLKKYKGKTGCGELGILNALYFAYNKQGARGLPDGVGLNELYNDIVETSAKVNDLKKDIKIQIDSCEKMKNEAKKASDDAIAEKQKLLDKKEHKKEFWASIILSIVAILASILIPFGLAYGWFDRFFKKQDNAPPPIEENIMYCDINYLENQDVINYEI